MKIAVIGSNIVLGKKAQAVLNTIGEVLFIQEYPSAEVIIQETSDADALITWGYISYQILETLPRLKFLCMLGAGWDHCIDPSITKEYTEKRGLCVCYTPGAASSAVAEYCLAAILGSVRGLIRAEKYRPENPLPNPMKAFNHLLVGIVGYGHIGSRLSNMLSNLQINHIIHTANPDKHLTRDMSGKFVDLAELCREADAIALTCQLNESTTSLIGNEYFNLMKEDVVIVNSTRAKVFHLKELHDFLIKRTSASVIIDDLYSMARLAPNILSLPNLFATPHFAFNTLEGLESYPLIAAYTLKSWTNGQIINTIW